MTSSTLTVSIVREPKDNIAHRHGLQNLPFFKMENPEFFKQKPVYLLKLLGNTERN